MSLREVGEFGLINTIKSISRKPDKQVIVGIGDDAAAFRNFPNQLSLLSTDTLVEGFHFSRSYFSYYEIGWKSVAVNLSDIAAMAGKPRYLLISISVPSSLDENEIVEFYRGANAICEQYNTAIIGGDTTTTTHDMVITVTVIGQSPSRNLKKRSGASIGEGFFVTGTLGNSHAGFLALSCDNQALISQAPTGVKRHLLPQPRLFEASFLVENFPVGAMIDISDGLSSEVHHICSQSNLGALIDVCKVPISDEVINLAGTRAQACQDYALGGGEDYELLFTAPAEYEAEIAAKMSAKFGLQCTMIGLAQSRAEGIQLRDFDGKLSELPFLGWNHFAKS